MTKSFVLVVLVAMHAFKINACISLLGAYKKPLGMLKMQPLA